MIPPIRFSQTLQSGISIRQDIGTSIRFVMFETECDGWEYATDGGTAFIVRFAGKYFALTCNHVGGTFHWKQLALTTTKFSTRILGVDAVAKANGLELSEQADLDDMAIVEIDGSAEAAVFEDSAYVLEAATCCRSNPGDLLMVCGAHKGESWIDGETRKIAPSFHRLYLRDAGPFGTDPVLRSGVGELNEIGGSVIGFSGAPVFNITQGRLAGVMVRGGVQGKRAVIYYIEIEHYLEMLSALVDGREVVRYRSA